VLLQSGDGQEAAWQGQVTRLLGDLETTGLMARVLVTVPDPLRLAGGRRELPLLIGSYVRVEISAGRLNGVLEVPRTALREGDRVWLVGPDNLLQIRETEILWRNDDSVLITNSFQPGEVLVVSEIRAPLPGMLLAPQPLDPRTGTASPGGQGGVAASNPDTQGPAVDRP
jgi:multidrug efflux pump subunit AcrA (membrane-fusion protein)